MSATNGHPTASATPATGVESDAAPIWPTAIFVPTVADAEAVARAIPGVVALAFPEAIAESEARLARTCDVHDVLIVVTGDADAIQTGQARRILRVARSRAENARAVSWLNWTRPHTFAPPRGFTTPGQVLAYLMSLPDADLDESSPPAEQAGTTADDGRPVIAITTEEHQVIDQAAAALAAEPSVYHRGNELVTILTDAPRRRGEPDRPAGTPRLVSLPSARLRDLLTRRARWVKILRGRKAEAVPAHPPDWAVAGLAARGQWPDLRPIEAITEAPTLRPDGSIVDYPGWDEATGILYQPNAEFPPVAECPTQEDARAAAAELGEVVADFPFVGPDHRAAWIAAALTPLARWAIDGPCPLFLFDGNTPGVGKSKLCDLIAILATGRPMARSGYPEDEPEMAKTILSVAMAADRMLLFDNVPTGFSIGGKSLDRALTATTIKGRILGRSEMSGEIPLPTVFYEALTKLALE